MHSVSFKTASGKSYCAGCDEAWGFIYDQLGVSKPQAVRVTAQVVGFAIDFNEFKNEVSKPQAVRVTAQV